MLISRLSKSIVFSGLLILLAQSCVPGRQAANRFLQKRSAISVMLVPPIYTYLAFYPQNPATLPHGQDSAYSLDSSQYLKELDVQSSQELFAESLYKQLSYYKLKVYRPEQFDEFLTQPNPKYIFTVAQSEILEYDDVFTDRALIDTLLYRQSFNLRTVSQNTWFEFVKVDEPDSSMQVLYSTFFTSDFIDGRFRYRWTSGEVTYEYIPYMITLNDVYELNRFAGQQNAAYIFDFLLNRYVRQNAKYYFGAPEILQYDIKTNTVRKARDSKRFIIMEP